ncbi:hypothetical protein D1814_11685 [Alteromonas sp. BL110]|uniref:DUF6644 family protein n=1 Tax=Alteromonas sp. BL110 TaxID=1714845 RepID=UPI000E4BCFE4|nr:DUF6644 family protein [Alteromonas sp. BL110]AXT39285.1 hypothetical protein D1814_11685 [Alteromonas sp. BL110]RKM82231.1 hypothetical protein D7031_07870 [Alteromonas sp. BL110]
MNTFLSKVIDTLQSSPLNHFVMDNAVVFPVLEMAHFLGLSLLFGALLIVDLRLVGVAKKIPLNHVESFLRFALIGFAINAITGVLFVIGDPSRYLVNIAFGLKMLVIGLAGVNTLYFVKRVKPQLHNAHESQAASAEAAIVAWLSIALWVCVIILGRFIPYLETP